MNRSETSFSSISGVGTVDLRCSSSTPPRSESEDHLVFLGLEYGIADSQAARREHGRRGHQAEPRPSLRAEHVVEQFDEVIRRVELEQPLRAFGKELAVDRVEDRRYVVSGFDEHR